MYFNQLILFGEIICIKFSIQATKIVFLFSFLIFSYFLFNYL